VQYAQILLTQFHLGLKLAHFAKVHGGQVVDMAGLALARFQSCMMDQFDHVEGAGLNLEDIHKWEASVGIMK
jgi:hypothetical protein